LGATIVTQELTHNYVGAKVSEWSSEVLLLAKIAESQCQAAYSTLIATGHQKPLAFS